MSVIDANDCGYTARCIYIVTGLMLIVVKPKVGSTAFDVTNASSWMEFVRYIGRLKFLAELPSQLLVQLLIHPPALVISTEGTQLTEACPPAISLTSVSLDQLSTVYHSKERKARYQ
ncbi:hypothetical protein CSKR_203274 [Clonorchis sinensis]|uniref:Uncharacterized protein n=1 Tax=Clonorchis sinensis TaxID=79923 RepID=A0A8T1M9Q6_CLOSI|nr:hypothetical protein CSKR_203274 [Clonorchis sinensis]